MPQYEFIEPSQYNRDIEEVEHAVARWLLEPWKVVWAQDGQRLTFTRDGVTYGEPFVAFQYHCVVAHGEALEDEFWAAFGTALRAYIAVAVPQGLALGTFEQELATAASEAAEKALEELLEAEIEGWRMANRGADEDDLVA